MNRWVLPQHRLLAVAWVCALGFAGDVVFGEESTARHLVVIVADDVGIGDLGCYGGSAEVTPNIDRLAADGVRFTSAYSCSTVCAPARAGLFTGRYPQRCGYVMTTGSYRRQVELDRGVPTSETLLVEPLRDAGYRTALIGKWHLGVNERYRPTARGFDEFFGFLGGVHDYYQWQSEVEGSILRGEEAATGEEYLTDAFSHEAVEFIDRNHDRPFLLVVAYSAVHAPPQVPQRYQEPFADDPTTRIRRAMMHAVDVGVGRILGKLDELELSDQTLVVFTSDNGAAEELGNANLRGLKGRLHEGGLRVPLLVRWPGQAPAGAECDALVSLLDVMPTAAAAAGVDVAELALDGMDLLAATRAEPEEPFREELFFSFGAYQAIRRGDHKLMRAGPLVELYDLAEDPREEHDLAPRRAELREDLDRRLREWAEQMPDPLWLHR